MSSGVQTLSFKKPTNGPEKPKTQQAPRHTGILQDQLRRAQRRPWSPSFSLALRILFLVRMSGAMYANIADCDEVFNFWEPLHFLQHNYGFQTWEVSPQFALRSWSYILLHYLPPKIGSVVLPDDKRANFFAVRIFLAVLSTFAEVKFYRTICEKINERVGRYLFFMLLFNAGMWNASTSFLPSSFAMYTTTLACSYAFVPSSSGNSRHTLVATLIFALGAIVGWPFALALAIPFVIEELFVYGVDIVTPDTKGSWIAKRWKRLFRSGLAAASIFLPVVGIDSLAYGKFSIVPWNIVKYNIFGGADRGPDLYGTEPWHFYLKNLGLNFNYLLPVALVSLPALGVTYVIDRKRLGYATPTPNQSSPFTLLALRLAPFYLWLGILTLQPHKEERFMFPAYPLLCFNAAVAVYLVRGWLEVAFIKATNSPYRAAQSSIFRNFTLSIVLTSSVLSISRILALWFYYHAPMTVAFHFQAHELPQLLNDTGLLPIYPAGTPEEDIPRIDLSPLKEFDLTLCLGKEWYRFPGSYLVPSEVKIDFIKSEFDGMLPTHFEQHRASPALAAGDTLTAALSKRFWFKPQTTFVPDNLNDLNKENLSQYVSVDTCDYLIDLDFPLHPVESALEPRYAVMEETWERVFCHPFLDARHSYLPTRTFWLPFKKWQDQNEFGDYCLLKNRSRVKAKQHEAAERVVGGAHP